MTGLNRRKLLQPEKKLARWKRDVKEKFEHPIDEGPGNACKNKRERPFFALTDFELQKGAERRSDGKTEQPDRYEPAKGPSKNTGGAAIDYLLWQSHLPVRLRPMCRPLSASAAGQVQDELNGREPEHRKSQDPGKEPCGKGELPALPQCGEKDEDKG